MPEISKSKAFNPSNLFWIGLAAIIAAFYFYGLNIPLLGPDEPRYAQVAREMFERGDWVTPTLGGFHWFEKPVLLYWLEILSYTFFGVSEFSARFGSAVFGLATVASLWILGRHARLGDTRAFSSYLAADRGVINWDNRVLARRKLRYYSHVPDHGRTRKLFHL